MKKTKIENRGGAREGAGRPKLDKVPVLIRPRKSTLKRMRARAKQERLTLGELLDTTF